MASHLVLCRVYAEERTPPLGPTPAANGGPAKPSHKPTHPPAISWSLTLPAAHTTYYLSSTTRDETRRDDPSLRKIQIGPGELELGARVRSAAVGRGIGFKKKPGSRKGTNKKTLTCDVCGGGGMWECIEAFSREMRIVMCSVRFRRQAGSSVTGLLFSLLSLFCFLSSFCSNSPIFSVREPLARRW